MNIYVFLFCYNEEILLPYTIAHYKMNLPSCKIIIIDNESNDNSVEIAMRNNCDIIKWTTNNMTNEFSLRDMKNDIWKKMNEGWVIVADMDEWLDINENNLQTEYERGTSVLIIEGVDVIGESEKEDLSDINLHTINKFVRNAGESKKLCFLREKIQNMNYDIGAHAQLPGIEGHVKYSGNRYINKHMNYLGLPYIINKTINRYNRSDEMRKCNLNIHYTDNIDNITKRYKDHLEQSVDFPTIIHKMNS